MLFVFQVRDQLMDWVAEREMKIYQLFVASGGADTSKLDRFERRFQWYLALNACKCLNMSRALLLRASCFFAHA